MNNTTSEILFVFDDHQESLVSRLFWSSFFISFASVSLLFFYFYFYQFFRQRRTSLDEKLSTHTLLCLIINDFMLVQTELPLTVIYLLRHRVLLPTHLFCVIWNYFYFNWSTISIQFSMLTAINRYLLVFHKPLLIRYKFWFHYFPILCTWLYLPCLYLHFIVFFPAGNTSFDYSKQWCGGSPFLLFTFYAAWDALFNTFAPVLILIFFNVVITIRVTCLKKISTNSAKKWRKNRRLILQLVAICCSHMIGSVPYCIVTLGVVFSSLEFGAVVYYEALIYAFYIPSLCSPLFAVITLPKERRKKLTWLFDWNRSARTNTKTKMPIKLKVVNSGAFSTSQPRVLSNQPTTNLSDPT